MEMDISLDGTEMANNNNSGNGSILSLRGEVIIGAVVVGGGGEGSAPEVAQIQASDTLLTDNEV